MPDKMYEPKSFGEYLKQAWGSQEEPANDETEALRLLDSGIQPGPEVFLWFRLFVTGYITCTISADTFVLTDKGKGIV